MGHKEKFSEHQTKILQNFVSNISDDIFVLHNLPEVVKGALFSRYSRSTDNLRTLLFNEFILNKENFIPNCKQDQKLAIKKAQDFYDRILDSFGDDSIGELGGAHLAMENISILSAKFIEDCRIGGSPLEKSSRYVCFNKKENGKYLFYKDKSILESEHKSLYLDTCNMLFDTYSEMIPQLTEKIKEKFPKEKETSPTAYKASVKAKVLDCLRGLLPSSALTNLGLFGNGRFFENLIKHLKCNHLRELQEMGEKTYEELDKIIPSFVKRACKTHKNQIEYEEFQNTIRGEMLLASMPHLPNIPKKPHKHGAHLISYDPLSLERVAAALLFEISGNASLFDLQKYCQHLPEGEIDTILESASNARKNRRHKSPRALEHANFTFEIVADFGAYRDLQRHRMLTQERQPLSCEYGYAIPEEILGSDMEEKYRLAMQNAKAAFNIISQDLPLQAQYVVPMAYNIRWYFHVNLRALQWLCELRSSPAGHHNYRVIAQDLAKQVYKIFPPFKRFFKFVDHHRNDLGRLSQEEKVLSKNC